MYKKPNSTLILAIFTGLLCFSCKQDENVRQYKEIAPPPTPTNMTNGMGNTGAEMAPPENTSPVNIDITWTLPENWKKSDSASAMRVGSFIIPNADPELNIDVSVVQFPGMAGGVEANVMRWMKQIGIAPDSFDLKEFLLHSEHFKTLSAQDGLLIDLTNKLSGDITQSKSIFGALISTAEYTVFVKGMGHKQTLIKNKSSLVTFCKSLRIENHP